ncbi:hypothetical protein HZB89_01670, partial [archaeon]|nr:hypothetical protein [archaeon]
FDGLNVLLRADNLPAFDAILFNKKGTRKSLSLILDEGDDIVSCIRQGMKEHCLSEARVDGMEGKIREGIANYMSGSHYKSKKLDNQEIIMASGGYKLSFDELFGSMNITTGGKPPITATFVKGKACQNLKVMLSFIEIEGDKPKATEETESLESKAEETAAHEETGSPEASEPEGESEGESENEDDSTQDSGESIDSTSNESNYQSE